MIQVSVYSIPAMKQCQNAYFCIQLAGEGGSCGGLLWVKGKFPFPGVRPCSAEGSTQACTSEFAGTGLQGPHHGIGSWKGARIWWPLLPLNLIPSWTQPPCPHCCIILPYPFHFALPQLHATICLFRWLVITWCAWEGSKFPAGAPAMHYQKCFDNWCKAGFAGRMLVLPTLPAHFIRQSGNKFYSLGVTLCPAHAPHHRKQRDTQSRASSNDCRGVGRLWWKKAAFYETQLLCFTKLKELSWSTQLKIAPSTIIAKWLFICRVKPPANQCWTCSEHGLVKAFGCHQYVPRTGNKPKNDSAHFILIDPVVDFFHRGHGKLSIFGERASHFAFPETFWEAAPSQFKQRGKEFSSSFGSSSSKAFQHMLNFKTQLLWLQTSPNLTETVGKYLIKVSRRAGNAAEVRFCFWRKPSTHCLPKWCILGKSRNGKIPSKQIRKFSQELKVLQKMDDCHPKWS